MFLRDRVIDTMKDRVNGVLLYLDTFESESSEQREDVQKASGYLVNASSLLEVVWESDDPRKQESGVKLAKQFVSYSVGHIRDVGTMPYTVDLLANTSRALDWVAHTMQITVSEWHGQVD